MIVTKTNADAMKKKDVKHIKFSDTILSNVAIPIQQDVTLVKK